MPNAKKNSLQGLLKRASFSLNPATTFFLALLSRFLKFLALLTATPFLNRRYPKDW